MTRNNENFADHNHFKRNLKPQVIEKILNMNFDCKEIHLENFIEICEFWDIETDYCIKINNKTIKI